MPRPKRRTKQPSFWFPLYAFNNVGTHRARMLAEWERSVKDAYDVRFFFEAVNDEGNWVFVDEGFHTTKCKSREEVGNYMGTRELASWLDE